MSQHIEIMSIPNEDKYQWAILQVQNDALDINRLAREVMRCSGVWCRTRFNNWDQEILKLSPKFSTKESQSTNRIVVYIHWADRIELNKNEIGDLERAGRHFIKQLGVLSERLDCGL